MEKHHLGLMIRFHRKEAGLTQEELANLAGLGKTVVFDIEGGKLTIKFDTILKIFKVLNITIDFKSPLMNAFLEQLNEKG